MGNYKNLIFNDFCTDAWIELKNSKLPILIYGMGNGADKIIRVFEQYGIEYQDVFASDGFVRGHSYKGKTVISYSSAIEKYPQGFDIVISFGSKLPDVIEKIYSLENKHRVYALDVPVCGELLFNEEFFNKHENELFCARELLADEKSKQVFDDIVRFKLSGRLCYLKSSQTNESDADALLQCDKYKIYADLGAYNGDTIRKYTAICPNINKIYAFEPDIRNFKKLCTYCEGIPSIEFILLNNPACETNRSIDFSASGNRNSSSVGNGSFQHKKITLEGKALDLVADSVDFIKYDVEGLEFEALNGSKRIINE
jgi:FkbM family methyltransferase